MLSHDTHNRWIDGWMNRAVLEVFWLVGDAGELERALGKMCTRFETVCQSIGVFQRCNKDENDACVIQSVRHHRIKGLYLVFYLDCEIHF